MAIQLLKIPSVVKKFSKSKLYQSELIEVKTLDNLDNKIKMILVRCKWKIVINTKV